MFGNDRHSLRQVFFDTWQKAQQGLLLSPLETNVLEVITLHPEYHDSLKTPARYADKDYLPEMGETNPFLHMSGHLGLREQIATNRPKGIAKLYQALLKKHQGDKHLTEHLMIDCMMEIMWQAQRDGRAPEDREYIKKLKRL